MIVPENNLLYWQLLVLCSARLGSADCCLWRCWQGRCPLVDKLTALDWERCKLSTCQCCRAGGPKVTSLTGITATRCLFWFNHTTPDTIRWAGAPRFTSSCQMLFRLFQTWPPLVVLLRASVLTLPSVTKDRSWAFVDFQFKFSLG